MNQHTFKVLEFDKIKEILLKQVSSPLGREKIERIVPSTDLTQIQKEQNLTSEGTFFISTSGFPPFGLVNDVRYYVTQATIGAILGVDEFVDIRQTLKSFRELKKYFSGKSTEALLLSEIADKLKVFEELEKELDRCFDERKQVKDNASKELSAIRSSIRHQHNEIQQKLNSIIHSPDYQKMIQEPIITQREDRYVIPLKSEHRSSFPSITIDQSASGATYFVEPLATVNLNNKLRELKLDERQEINRILRQLSLSLSEVGEEIMEVLEVVGRLDSIMSRARLSLNYKGISPLLNTYGLINIKQGRHPLLTGNAVPVNVQMGDKYKILVITGPNTGGKTVTLKMIGLFVLMAQCGLHIPAESDSQLCIFDRVFADIGDEQSISQNLSTFSSHMSQIIKILPQADEKSLVLLDELGAGTDPGEGAALAVGVLLYLHKCNSTTAATTHYNEVKAFASTYPGVINGHVEFDLETLRPTFELVIGLPGRSHAFAIAQRLGMSEEIILSSQQFRQTKEIFLEELLSSCEKERNLLTEERRKLTKDMEEVSDQLRLLKKEQDNLTKRKDQLLKDVRSQVEDLLTKTKRETNLLIREVQGLKAETRQKVQGKLEQLEDSLKDLENEWTEKKDITIEPEEIITLNEGDKVFIPQFSQEGTVLSVPKDGKVLVQTKNMRLTLPITQLQLVKTKNSTEKKYYTVRHNIRKTEQVRSQLDLRGCRVDDCLYQTEKYIDDALLSRLEQIRLVHGKGTGALRSALHDYLRDHPQVESFRLGDTGEGGAGATIVRLKQE